MSSDRDLGQYIQGAFYGLAAVSIWSGWIVIAQLGLRSSLTPWDIAALRFGVAGIVMLPLVLSRGLAIDRLGWIGLGLVRREAPVGTTVAVGQDGVTAEVVELPFTG